jgi:hypothetical protein
MVPYPRPRQAQHQSHETGHRRRFVAYERALVVGGLVVLDMFFLSGFVRSIRVSLAVLT